MEDECISCTVYFQQSVVSWVYYVTALSNWWIMVVGFFSNDCFTSTEHDRLCCSRFCCCLFDLSQPLACPSFVIHHYPGLFVNTAKMQAEEPRAGRHIFPELFWHSWHKVDGRGNSKLLSSGRRCFTFSLVSGVLCGRPILLTHQPWGDWFGVSCRDLESWP